VIEAELVGDAALLEGVHVHVVLGCTEIPLMLGEEALAKDLLSPAALLAEAAVRAAIGDIPLPR